MKTPASLVAAAWLALGLLAAPLAARAGSTVEIGRVKVLLAEDGWQAVDAKAEGMGLNSPGGTLGVEGNIAGQAKLLTLRGADGAPQAIVLIYATYGTGKSVRVISECPAVDWLYVNDLAKGRSEAPECVILGGPFPAKLVIDKGFLPRIATASAAVGFNLPPEAYLVDAFFANSSGAVIAIEALLSPQLKGLEASPAGGPLPARLRPDVAAWGDALGLAIRAALRSFSGELRLPAVTFR